jgi:hypothetical protein
MPLCLAEGCDGTMTAGFGECAWCLVRRLTVWSAPVLAFQESRQPREEALQSNTAPALIFARLDKTRCPPFVGQQHSPRAGREPGTPQSLKVSESALVLRKTLGVVSCGLREPPPISRPNFLTIPVHSGFRDGIDRRIAWLHGDERLPFGHGVPALAIGLARKLLRRSGGHWRHAGSGKRNLLRTRSSPYPRSGGSLARSVQRSR